MDRRDHKRRQARREKLTAMRGDPETGSEQRLRGRRAKQHDGARFDDADFLVEPGAAPLAGARLLECAPRGSQLKCFTAFVTARASSSRRRLIEQVAGGPTNGFSDLRDHPAVRR